MRYLTAWSLTLPLLPSACDTTDPQGTCDVSASEALQICLADYSDRLQDGYETTGASCPADDPSLLQALNALEGQLGNACAEGSFGAVDPSALPARLANACASEASSLAWRSFGGPQGTAAPGSGGLACLSDVHEHGQRLLADSLAAIDTCVAEGCAEDDLLRQRATLTRAAEDAMASDCLSMASAVGLSPATFAENTAQQVDCLTAAARSATEGLGLTCGPSYALIDPPRGEWSEVIVDGDQWGTQCGDGSTFAFWIRPAPEGAPLDRVAVALQGGGVCLGEPDCAPRFDAAPGLFSARDADDEPLSVGIASDDPAISPFHDYTMIYVPYCNQDVFAGGGVVEDLGSVQLPRYGAVNLRASVRILRDYLWRALDDAGGDGFRSDQVVALFGGFSAGGYGTLYNYHWFLDDLLWPQTTAFPDGGLAVDNGELLGVGSLGAVKIPDWGMQPYLPPYCFDGPCSGGQTLVEALSPRLQQVPNQNMLMLSNQLDSTQRGDAFFSDDASFINALRQMYCDTRDLPGIYWYLTSVSTESVHVVSPRDELFTGSVDGQVMSDFFLDAVDDPSALTSRVEEGDFVEAVDGVAPFPCELP